MTNQFFYGSICLSDIPKELIKKAENGKYYLNISVGTRIDRVTGQSTPDQFGRTHYISCRPKKEQQVEGTNYFIGDLTLYQPKSQPTTEDIDKAPAVTQDEIDQMPF